MSLTTQVYTDHEQQSQIPDMVSQQYLPTAAQCGIFSSSLSKGTKKSGVSSSTKVIKYCVRMSRARQQSSHTRICNNNLAC